MGIQRVHIAMDACWDERRKWEIYNEKIYKRAQSVHNLKVTLGGARGVMVIVVGNGHGDTSSNPGRDWLHFT